MSTAATTASSTDERLRHRERMSEQLPPEAVVMSAVTRLGVPELLAKHGALSARQLTAHGVEAEPELLQRALRACAIADAITLVNPRSGQSIIEGAKRP
jgi:hypothetical protein